MHTPRVFISQFCKSLCLLSLSRWQGNVHSASVLCDAVHSERWRVLQLAECCVMPYILNGEVFYNWLSVVRCRTFWTVKCSTTGWVLCDAVHSERWRVLQLAECCAMPYILNGEVYYNCSVNAAESNDLGCYYGDGQSQWAKCQQPHGMYVVTFCFVCYVTQSADLRRQRGSAHAIFQRWSSSMLFDPMA